MIDSTRKFVRYLMLANVSAVLSLFILPDAMMVLSVLLSLTGALYGFNMLLTIPDSRGNFFLVAAETIVLGSSLGLLFSYVSITYVSYDIWSAVIEYTYTTSTDLALAQAYTNLFAIILFLMGFRVQQWGWPNQIQASVAHCLHAGKAITMRFVVIVMLCQVYFFRMGIIVYGGKVINAAGEPTHPLLALLFPLAPVLPFVLAYYLHRAYKTARFVEALLYLVLLLVELFWFFLFGRRTTIFFFIVSFAGFFFGNGLNVRYLLKNAIPILLVSYAALKMADTYHKVRVAYSFQGAQQMSLVDVFAGLAAVDNGNYEKLRNMNVAARASYSSIALGQFINLFRTTMHKPLMGQALLSGVLLATPSDFMVDKKTIVAKEALYERIYSLGLTDISETLYLESFIDFGWFGFLIYPAFLFALLCLIYYLAAKAKQPLFSLIVVCVSISLALTMVETDMITFLAAVRTLFVGCLLTLFSGKKSKYDKLHSDINREITIG